MKNLGGLGIQSLALPLPSFSNVGQSQTMNLNILVN